MKQKNADGKKTVKAFDSFTARMPLGYGAKLAAIARNANRSMNRQVVEWIKNEYEKIKG